MTTEAQYKQAIDIARVALKWYGDLVYSHHMGLPPEVQWVAEKALEHMGMLVPTEGDGRPFPSPEWVKLIPADSIPVFCFPSGTYDAEIERVRDQLVAFFGEGKVLVVRGEVEIYAIAEAANDG